METAQGFIDNLSGIEQDMVLSGGWVRILATPDDGVTLFPAYVDMDGLWVDAGEESQGYVSLDNWKIERYY